MKSTLRVFLEDYIIGCFVFICKKYPAYQSRLSNFALKYKIKGSAQMAFSERPAISDLRMRWCMARQEKYGHHWIARLEESEKIWHLARKNLSYYDQKQLILRKRNK